MQQLPAYVPEGPAGDCLYYSSNFVKLLCTAAARVTVTRGGIIKMVPVVQASYNYSSDPYSNQIATMNCKDLNASGLFSSGSTAAATLMLYDDLGGPLSSLTKTGPHQVTLSTGHAYTGSQRYSVTSCSFNYTVVSGCVLGARPPTKPLACPAGFMVKTGKFNIKYCSPCPPGTSSPGPNSASCKPCAAGTTNDSGYGGLCIQCPENTYKPKAGITGCRGCPAGTTSGRGKGIKCHKCPPGSLPSGKQCYRCQAGKRCCTVNWTSPAGGCPKCAAGIPNASHTSIFAFHSASSTSCMAASIFGRCAPKINITVDATCKITLSNLAYVNPLDNGYSGCKWSRTYLINGAKASAKVDLSVQYYWADWDSRATGGNITVTKVAAPYLAFYTPKDKCTLQYRALTKPAASILGAPPKPCRLSTPGCPTASYSCPAGQYREVNTDTKPPPCLVCPPGTFSPKASRATACTPCPVGTYAPGYGSKRCSSCPAARVAPVKGSASCLTCDSIKRNTIRASPSTCQACPAKTGYYYPDFRSCIANVYGSICCAAGDCTGQTPCNASLTTSSGSYATYTAAMQMVTKSSSLSRASCKNETFLSCLQDNALVAFRSTPGPDLTAISITRPKCAAGPFEDTTYTYRSVYGGIVSSKRAILTSGNNQFQYEVASNKSEGTVTITLSRTNGYEVVTINPVLVPSCSATFKLVAGYTLDLTPPVGAQCPANAITRIVGERTSCDFCDSAEYKNASSQTCKFCPAGTYQNNPGSTSCKKCPPGFYCAHSAVNNPESCQQGQIAPQPGALKCKTCPANTYAFGLQPTTCKKCPPKTISPAGSSACGVPWDK